MIKISSDINNSWKQCDCVTISKGHRQYFDSCKVALIENKIFGYNDTDGVVSFFPVNESEGLRGDYIIGNFILADDQLRHFVVDGKWGLFSIETGEIIIDPVWDFIGHLDAEYIHVVKITKTPEGRKDICGTPFFNEAGEVNFSVYYEYLEHLDFCGAVHGAMDLAGQIVIPVEYDYLKEVYLDGETSFLVQKDNKMALLSANHEVIIPFHWEDMEIIPDFYLNSYEKLIIVNLNQKFGVINRSGEIIIPLDYDKLALAHINGEICFLVTVAGKQGILSRKNEILIPIKWDLIAPDSISNSGTPDVHLWEGLLSFMLCFKKSDKFTSLNEALSADEIGAYTFGIYDKQFNLVCAPELDGYSLANVMDFESLAVGQPVYGIITKDDQYGVITEITREKGVKVVSDPKLTYSEAMFLIEKHQTADYFNAIICDIEAELQRLKEPSGQIAKEVHNETSFADEEISISGRTRSQDELSGIINHFVTMLRELGEAELAEKAESIKCLMPQEQSFEISEQFEVLLNQIEWLTPCDSCTEGETNDDAWDPLESLALLIEDDYSEADLEESFRIPDDPNDYDDLFI